MATPVCRIQPDGAPLGDTVMVSGSGWNPGSNYTVVVTVSSGVLDPCHMGIPVNGDGTFQAQIVGLGVGTNSVLCEQHVDPSHATVLSASTTFEAT